ncbi:MAG: hypothetical protein KME07_01430 [Pegethrix bostrychoides GSE-TBD4-15B]|uniref:Uncharacterized protein n=1 Tax=Pegethrix bostrychoides GSE-TBD4-15B TaxID=2839662 RepID=A0A951U366_9CYAN|nr:hypothetical protein [Pegethrix bostrychoides GSE-TBD4-15B]
MSALDWQFHSQIRTAADFSASLAEQQQFLDACWQRHTAAASQFCA